jgi:hypothetical protein
MSTLLPMMQAALYAPQRHQSENPKLPEPFHLLSLVDVALLRNVQTVQEL